MTLDEHLKRTAHGRHVNVATQVTLSFAANPTVMNNIDALYAYLKGRSDGAITRARVEPMDAAGAGS